jgi:hypothetical protein
VKIFGHDIPDPAPGSSIKNLTLLIWIRVFLLCLCTKFEFHVTSYKSKFSQVKIMNWQWEHV